MTRRQRFICRDPLGRWVILWQNTWDEHILPGHPELRGRALGVKAAIETPDQINQDATRPMTRSCYYKFGVSAPVPGAIIKVVAEFDVDDPLQPGAVCTAYILRRISKRGERLLWPANTQS